MLFDLIHIDETDSTNALARSYTLQGKGIVVWADYQTAGRGQGTNTWESARGENLTLSIRFRPESVKAAEQFIISMAISVALTQTLDMLHGVSIKWPNDIYVGDRKICGILIENVLKGGSIKDCIIGIGLNVNQTHFVSDAPNPTSMAIESGSEHDRQQVLDSLLRNFGALLDHWDAEGLRRTYRQLLYRREGMFDYSDKDGLFRASLAGVEDDGHLLLRDGEGRLRRYAFKEVNYRIKEL